MELKGSKVVYKVFFLILLSLPFFNLVADQKLVTENYSAVACYYIPGWHEFDDHPFEKFNKMHLDDRFISSFKERLEGLTMTFPKDSSLSLNRKKQTVSMVNTVENHAKMKYLIKAYEIAYRGVQVKTILELVEVPDNRQLLELPPAKLTRATIINSAGAKVINQFAVLSTSGRTARAMSNFSTLTVTPLINEEELQGDFEVEWQYEREGDKPQEVFLKTKFLAGNNESKVTQVQQSSGTRTRNLYCIFTFVFINNFGKILEPVQNEAVKTPDDKFAVRLYHLSLGKEDEKLLKEDVHSFFPKSKISFPKGSKLVWRPFVKTLILVNTEKNLKLADGFIPEEFLPQKQVKITAQVIEVSEKSALKDVKPGGVTYKDLMRVPAGKRHCRISFHCSSASGRSVKFIDTDEPIKKKSESVDDEDSDEEEKPRAGLSFEMTTQVEPDKSISVDFSWMNNTRTADGLKEQTLEFRYTIANGRPAVFQVYGDGKVSRYLVLKAEIEGE